MLKNDLINHIQQCMSIVKQNMAFETNEGITEHSKYLRQEIKALEEEIKGYLSDWNTGFNKENLEFVGHAIRAALPTYDFYDPSELKNTPKHLQFTSVAFFESLNRDFGLAMHNLEKKCLDELLPAKQDEEVKAAIVSADETIRSLSTDKQKINYQPNFDLLYPELQFEYARGRAITIDNQTMDEIKRIASRVRRKIEKRAQEIGVNLVQQLRFELSQFLRDVSDKKQEVGYVEDSGRVERKESLLAQFK